MGGFSWLARRPAAAGDPTHALFAAQSHSIVDNLVALFEHSRAWNCRHYFQKPAAALTISEAVRLAAVLPDPLDRSPLRPTRRVLARNARQRGSHSLRTRPSDMTDYPVGRA